VALYLRGNQDYVDESTTAAVSFTCALCDKPTELTRDLTTNEYGKSVHEECYAAHLRHQQALSAL
jgi:hypothetical protein